MSRDPRLVHWGYRDDDLEQVEVGEGADKHITRRVKDGAEMVPDGVMYERLSVLLIDVVKRQERRISGLEARIGRGQ